MAIVKTRCRNGILYTHYIIQEAKKINKEIMLFWNGNMGLPFRIQWMVFILCSISKKDTFYFTNIFFFEVYTQGV